MSTARLPAPPQRNLIDWLVFLTGIASLVVALGLTMVRAPTSLTQAPAQATPAATTASS